jgi:hypothetical protein
MTCDHCGVPTAGHYYLEDNEAGRNYLFCSRDCLNCWTSHDWHGGCPQ